MSEPDRVTVHLTLPQRFMLVSVVASRETGGADARMRLKRIARCCGLVRKGSEQAAYWDVMDPGDALSAKMEQVKNDRGQVVGARFAAETFIRYKVKLTTPDHKWLVDRIGEYDVDLGSASWDAVLEAFGFMSDEAVDTSPSPEPELAAPEKG